MSEVADDLTIEDPIQEEEQDIDTILMDKYTEIQNRSIEPETKPVSDETKTDVSHETDKTLQPENNQVASEAQETVRPPSSWKKDLQERFSTLPPEFQAEINRRENDFHKGIAEYKNAAEWTRQFEPLIPQLQELRQQYGSESAGIKQLLDYSKQADTDPIGFIKWFADSRGINLDGTGIPEQATNPTILALKQQVEQLSGYVQNERLTRQQQEEQQALQAIEAFKSKPESVHFDVLKADMAALLQAGQALSIEEAYDKALWMNPELRKTAISQQITAQQDQAKQEAKQKAEAAKKAAAVNVNKRGQLPSKQSDESLDEILEREAARLGFT